MSAQRPQWTRGIGLAAVLAVLTLLAYAPAFVPAPGNDFVDYDDDLYITDHPVVREGLTPHGVAWAFSSFHGANWFPLTRLSWMLDVSLFGVEAWAFHLTSLLLHIASTVLLFYALWRMTHAYWASAITAAVFGVHPLHVESVAWASYHRDVLSGLFFVLAIVAYERHVFVQRNAAVTGIRRWRPYGVVFVCLAMGLMAKPTLVTLPFVLLLLDVWPLDRFARDGAGGRLGWDAALVRRAVVEKLPLLALSLGSAAVTIAAQHSWNAVQSLDRIPLLMRIENALLSYSAYVETALWPSGLAVFYPHPGAQLVGWHAALAGVFVAGVTAGCFATLRRRPYLAVGWLWFLGMLLPVIGLVQVGAQARADRYMYLPLIGLSIAIVWGVQELALRSRRLRVASLAAAGVGCVALAVVTSIQVRTWRDTTTLFQHALAVTHDNYIAHINLGERALEEERFKDAIAHLVTALRIAPRAAYAHAALGELHLGQGNYREAEHHYRMALSRKPRNGLWSAGFAHAIYGQGRYPEAVAAYRTALDLEPDVPLMYVNLGLALAKSNEAEQALASYERALQLDPDLSDGHASLGIALLEDGRADDALPHLERTLALDPEHILVRVHLGQLLVEQGDFDQALVHLAEAVRLDPRNAAFRYLLASALERSGSTEPARLEMRHALAAAKASGDVDLAEQLRNELARLE